MTMRTPGHDFELAAGWVVHEGLVAPSALTGVAYCTDVDLAPEQERSLRLVWTPVWIRHYADDNPYAHPVRGLHAVLDLRAMKVVRIEDDGEAPIPAYVQGLLEQTAENLEALHTVIARNEDNRARVGEALVELAHHMAGLSELIRANQAALTRVADADRARADTMAEFRNELRSELRLIARTLASRPPSA